MSKRRFKCPQCGGYKTTYKGKRNGRERIVCKDCGKWFSIDHTNRKREKQRLRQSLTLAHLRGESYRSVALEYGLSLAQTYDEINAFLSSLPHLADFNRIYCDRWQGVALVDGKYIGVKGYAKEIPILWMLDYRTHMPVTFRVYPSESIQGYRQLFVSARDCGYPLKLVVCDDQSSIWTACQEIFPRSSCQLCRVHFKRSLAQQLMDAKPDWNCHQQFYNSVQRKLLQDKIPKRVFNKRAHDLLTYYQDIDDELHASFLVEIAQMQDKLQGHLGFKKAPVTTNMIEGFNAQIEDKVINMDNFSNLEHARLWTNGFFLNRALTPLRDCRVPFKRMNGRSPLEFALRDGTQMPTWDDLIACPFSMKG